MIEDEKLVIPLTSLEVALNMLDSVEKKQNELKEEVAVSGDLVLFRSILKSCWNPKVVQILDLL